MSQQDLIAKVGLVDVIQAVITNIVTKSWIKPFVKELLHEYTRVEVTAYNEPFGGPEIKVKFFFDEQLVSESVTSVPEPKTYNDY